MRLTPYPAAILLDLGDTLMDEGSEVKDPTGTTQSADLLAGTAEALLELHRQGQRLALVADAQSETPRNVLRQHGLMGYFETLAISENVGAEKPAPAIFRQALRNLGIGERDYGRVVMVGNNLERDVVGANRLGLRSIFFHSNERRRTRVLNRDEAPRHSVSNAGELVALIKLLGLPVQGAQPPRGAGTSAEHTLAVKHAPTLCFDREEPFLPEVVGYTVFHREAQSPSFYRRIERDWRPPWVTAIEYAIWWDWDIQHLYELEHVWVYLDDAGRVVWVEASSHGSYASMQRHDGSLALEGERPVVYAQPGKHAFAPSPQWFELFRDAVCNATGPGAGTDGVLVKPIYAREVPKNAAADAAACGWLRQRAFRPSFFFDHAWTPTPEQLVPWPVLDRWIPERMNWWLSRVDAE